MRRFRAGRFLIWLPLLAAPALADSVISVPSYKGIDYGWGSNTFGTPTYEHWLSDSYDPATVTRDLDAISGAGALTTTAWLFLDRCIVKDSGWGTPAFVPSFYPSCIANWEDFLSQLRAHHMSAIVNLLNRGSEVGGASASIERAALIPQSVDSSLLGPGTNNGDMAIASAGFPVGWGSQGPGQVSLIGPGNGLTSAGWALDLTATAAGPQSVLTPVVPYSGQDLLAITVPVRGMISDVSIVYYAADGASLGSDRWPVSKNFGAVWRTLVLGTGDPAVLPAGVAYVAIRVSVPAGSSGSVGPVQAGKGTRNGIWQSYLAALKAWVARYSGATEGGKSVIAWQPIDEGYSGIAWQDGSGTISPALLHSFYRAVYQTLREVPTHQPIGAESTADVLPVWSQNGAGALSNLNYYSDIADFYNLHLFEDDGAIPPGVSRFDKPWLIGAAGASADSTPAHFSDPSQPYEQNALAAFLMNAAPAGALAVLPWTYNTNPNLIYVEKTQAILGSAGQFLHDFRYDAHRNAASYSNVIAPGSLATAFGAFASAGTAGATSQPLPDKLAGVSVMLTDRAGASHPAPLIYVSPTQVVYQVPAETAPGLTVATVQDLSGFVGTAVFTLSSVGPGLFSADGSGSGPAAAVAARFAAGALSSWNLTAALDPKTLAPVNKAIDLSQADQTVVLELYGVGVRNYTSSVSVRIGETWLPVQYAGPAPGFPGLDQINVVLPASLAGAGAVTVQVVADGSVSNLVQIQIQ